MDGLVFTQLQRFDVGEPVSPKIFKQKVGMPACTHIVANQCDESLPVLQSNFHLPFLDTCELLSEVLDHHDERVISTLQMIHAKRFKFDNFSSSQGLMELLESKDEVEQLDLVIKSIFTSLAELEWAIFTRMSVNHSTMKVPCPNMKVLRLRFWSIRGSSREQLSRSCRQMMNNRRLAGYFLEKCYIWWDHEDWKNDDPLVLVMENEVVRVSSG